MIYQTKGKKMKHICIGAIIGALVLGASPASAAANLIINGDFTNPVVDSWGTFANIPGWINANGDDVEIGTNGTYGLPTTGSGFSLEVNANTFGDIVQTVSGLAPGKRYTIGWSYAGRDGGGPQAMDVSFGGNLLTTNTGSFGAWTLNSFSVVAIATTEVLEFKSLFTGGDPSYGNEIASVSVTAIPEPSVWLMMLMGFASLGFIGSLRKPALT